MFFSLRLLWDDWHHKSFPECILNLELRSEFTTHSKLSCPFWSSPLRRSSFRSVTFTFSYVVQDTYPFVQTGLVLQEKPLSSYGQTFTFISSGM